MKWESHIKLAVNRWAACAPGLNTSDDWQDWAQDGRAIAPGPANPNVNFVPAMKRRRLSSLSRMVFRAATDCLDQLPAPESYVFCSRFGEYQRSFCILQDLAQGNEVSPMAFSLSVHNTSASLFSIERHEQAPATALAAQGASLEAAFLEAWALIREEERSRVLLVYHDEPLPPLYRDQETGVTQACAVALLLQGPDSDPQAMRLALSWRAREATPVLPETEPEDPALQVLRLLIKGGPSITLDCGRLEWRWSRCD